MWRAHIRRRRVSGSGANLRTRRVAAGGDGNDEFLFLGGVGRGRRTRRRSHGDCDGRRYAAQGAALGATELGDKRAALPLTQNGLSVEALTETHESEERAARDRKGDELRRRSPKSRGDGGGRRPAVAFSCYGRSILQVVGRTVSTALTAPMVFQPQPVPSSSNFAPGSSGPKLPMYKSEKN